MNHRIFLDINDWARHTAWLHEAAKDYAGLGGLGWLVLLAVIAGLIALLRRDLARAGMAFWAPLSALVAVGIAQPINHAVAEKRPYVAMHHVLVLVARKQDFAFPSDHATAAGALALVIWFVHRWIGLIATFFALLLAFDRIYVGAHYPGDVVAGLALGAAVALVGALILRWLLDVILDRFKYGGESREIAAEQASIAAISRVSAKKPDEGPPVSD